ncbi:MAG: dipeptidase PepV [Eubacteriaceae bacterium]|nr:dipeptidase PepV [Eubacteriaceae bacterium]
MGYPEELKNKIDDNFEDQMDTLKELVAIESVVTDSCTSESGEEMPFGEGVQKAFEYVLEKGASFGFETDRAGNYGGHLETGGYEKNETMGIVCHLDTVPVGSDWTYDPLGCRTEDGKIYGRGTNDDKGPAVAALYAMKAIGDCGIDLPCRVRLILGLDEETDWVGMEKYLEEIEAPDYGFTPDADFPAINGEKGIMVFDIARKFGKTTGEGLALRSMKGGTAANMVASDARAVVNSKKPEIYEKIKEHASEWESTKGIHVNVRPTGKSLEITAKGVSVHGARPDLGINAISVLMEFLGTLSFVNDDVNDFIEFYNRHIGTETDGSSLGCRMEDEESGATVVNIGMIQMDTKAARLTVNVRYPISCTDEQVYRGLEDVCEKYNMGIVKGKHEKPIFIPETDPLIRTLMAVYREHTGDQESRPPVIGGGTYARAFDNVVAFGARFPGDEDVAHQKDEYITVDNFRKITHIYADAIYRLAKGEDSNGL